MEQLHQSFTDIHKLSRDDVDSEFQAIIASDKPKELIDAVQNISTRLHEQYDDVRDVLWWAADSLGAQKLTDYLEEFPYTPQQMIDDLAVAKTTEQKLAWQAIYGEWRRRPSLQIRYEQLTALKTKQGLVQQAYPELEFKLMSVPYHQIDRFMPPYRDGDTAPDRITNPASSLAVRYGGTIAVENHLLRNLRGEVFGNRQGSTYERTIYGQLRAAVNTYEDDGLCLIAKHAAPLETIKDIRLITGVDVSAGNMVTAIGLALKGHLRIGDDITLPAYIPSPDGDYCCGLRVVSEYTPHGDIPRLYFDRRAIKDVINCALVINP